eukprot:TRINITY_DN43384_c0_g1_i2.p2 TRINITY_DN43384_c0_g1~~TRINITY_DN43384_c0_g1_i2.p2  ORF type:complete len:142 (+),score=10.79 TRINITY_DN43384_c0_g1_i2:461-886(+)
MVWVSATPSIPPAMVTAQPASHEVWEASGRTALGLMDVAQMVATVSSQTETFALPQLVETAVDVLAAESVIPAPGMSLDPRVTWAPSSHPAVITAKTTRAELGPTCMSIALNFASAISTPAKIVSHLDHFTWLDLTLVVKQ